MAETARANRYDNVVEFSPRSSAAPERSEVPALRQSASEADIQRFGKGRDAWNVWAKANPGNPSCFRGHKFSAHADFSGFVFPGPAEFDNCQFLSGVTFHDAQFLGDAFFFNSIFEGNKAFPRSALSFDGVTFRKQALFDRARIRVPTNFEHATFQGSVFFEETHFSDSVSFRKSRLTGDLWCINARFGGAVDFSEIRVSGVANMSKSQFLDTCFFVSSKFDAPVTFAGCSFSGRIDFNDFESKDHFIFDNVNAQNTINFQRTKFFKRCSFDQLRCAKNAEFRESKFLGNAWFTDASFEADVWFPMMESQSTISFEGSDFHGTAGFAEAIFHGRANFIGCKFSGDADFWAITSNRGFSLTDASFCEVPNFIEAEFSRGPFLDDIILPVALHRNPRFGAIQSTHRSANYSLVNENVEPRPWLLRGIKAAANRNITQRFRALKAAAALSQDYQGEQKFYGLEVKSRRFWYDFPMGAGAGRFWIGLVYEVFSNFGMSMRRPVISWLAILALSTFYLVARTAYATESIEFQSTRLTNPISNQVLAVDLPVGMSVPCVDGNGDALSAAVYVSLNNSLMRIGADQIDELRRPYSCLFGGNVSKWSPIDVLFLTMFQALSSIVLGFFLLISIRNRMRLG